MFCTNCGTQCPDGSNFCMKCGFNFVTAAAAAAAAAPAAATAAAPVAQPAPAAQPAPGSIISGPPPIIDGRPWIQNSGVVNPFPVPSFNQYNPTFHCKCEYCYYEFDYHTYDLGHRAWYPHGFIYCPRCRKPLRHRLEYEVIENPAYAQPGAYQSVPAAATAPVVPVAAPAPVPAPAPAPAPEEPAKE